MPGRSKGTDTLTFINKEEIPGERWKDVAHSRIVCNVRPQKEEVNRTRLTFGGQNLDVPIDCGTPTASLLTIKLLLNSVVLLGCHRAYTTTRAFPMKVRFTLSHCAPARAN